MVKREQCNTSITYGDRLILKFFRHITEGLNPDVEVGRFITEKTSFPNVPALAGYLELRKTRGEPATLAILQALATNEGDAWRYTMDRLGHYFEDVLTRQLNPAEAILPNDSLFALADAEIPALAQETIGPYLSSARLLGQRTGELHIALASDGKDPDFAPEPLTALYRRSLYQRLRKLADYSLNLLERRLKTLPQETRADAAIVLRPKCTIID